MIVGDPASCTRRSGTRTGGLQRRYSRTRVTRPVVRTWIASAAPVHTGLPLRQMPTRPQSSSPGCQALQRPVRLRARNHGVPSPCQCRPTRLKRGAAAASVRDGWGKTSRTNIRTGAACAAPAGAKKTAAAERRRLTGPDPFSTVPDRSCSGKLVAVILTTVKRALLLTMLAALAAASSASAQSTKVLAIRFGPDLEVNPVTKDYVNH